MILTKTSVDNHLVKVEEDNEAILRVELDKAHLLAEVLDHHPGLPLLGLASQRVGSKLWLSRLEEEMPAHKKMIDRNLSNLSPPSQVHSQIKEERRPMVGWRRL